MKIISMRDVGFIHKRTAFLNMRTMHIRKLKRGMLITKLYSYRLVTVRLARNVTIDSGTSQLSMRHKNVDKDYTTKQKETI